MDNGRFDIATEDGNLFCQCEGSGETVMFYGKSGKLSFELLVKQIMNPDLAKQMRGKKLRQKHSKRTMR